MPSRRDLTKAELDSVRSFRHDAQAEVLTFACGGTLPTSLVIPSDLVLYYTDTSGDGDGPPV
jgi:hypothetical protein